ncbi:family transcriptional regulator [Chlorella sorokiniana]|uniref:Family transcriptional regulator n=1 Tax=Chlorella sorokiniana TaxID=3076 RepID=A0A2P6U4Q2_CHLSO|nr:family transcriptional regulator [Chlorella sorokiniana]|eukprot:PRW61291.1 family transcriptional regulator [Chlorella sorokiniana]
MEEPLGSQIATSAVPGSTFARVPSSSRMAGSGSQPGGEPVSWDEMGQLGLHRALHEYYKLSASQRNMRLCSRGGPPGVLCTLLHTLLVPQLPAALSPPVLFAAAGALLYATAWLLYNTAALTIPLALWAAFAADGSLALTPVAAAAAAQMLPAAADPLPLPLPALLAAHRGAGLLLLPLLLLALRLSEAVVLRRRQQRWEAARRAVTTADVQARFAGWALPGASNASVSAEVPAASGGGAAAHHEQRQLARQQEAALLREVGQLWQAVYGEGLQAEHLQTLPDVAAAVGRLCKDTGVPVPAAAAAAGSDTDGALLLGLVQQIKAAVGVA